MGKKCKRCHVWKYLEYFYKHSQMADGHINICKECKKEEERKRSSSPRGREIDRARQSTPRRKKERREMQKKYRIKNRKKDLARRIFWNTFRYGSIPKLPCQVCGVNEFVEAHHCDYDKPLEVMWLCGFHHKEWHKKHIPLNQN